MKKYKKELVDLIATHTRNWQNIIKSTYRYIYDDIIQNTPVVFSNTTISTKVYCYLNDIEQLPTCKICGKQLDDINKANMTREEQIALMEKTAKENLWQALR